MRGFRLDQNHDVVISSAYRDIETTQDSDLERQTIETVLSTNRGEWFFDLKEGINHRNILGKGKSEDLIRGEIVRGLAQVDGGLMLGDFACEVSDRRAKVNFTAKKESGEMIEGVDVTWQ